MDLLATPLGFAVIIVVVALGGLGLGLLVAPRLTAWDDARARRDDAPAVGDGGGDGGADGDGPGAGERRDGMADEANGGGDDGGGAGD